MRERRLSVSLLLYVRPSVCPVSAAPLLLSFIYMPNEAYSNKKFELGTQVPHVKLKYNVSCYAILRSKCQRLNSPHLTKCAIIHIHAT